MKHRMGHAKNYHITKRSGYSQTAQVVSLYHENLIPHHGELFSTLSSSALLVGLRLTGYEPMSLFGKSEGHWFDSPW
jgi:hypothetical protein